MYIYIYNHDQLYYVKPKPTHTFCRFTISVWVLKYPTLSQVAINIQWGLNLDNPLAWTVALCIISLAFASNEGSVDSLKYTLPMPLISTSAQYGEIKYLSFIGNGSGLNWGTGLMNDITPFVLTYRTDKKCK